MPSAVVSPPSDHRSSFVRAAERLVRRVERLTDEVVQLRADNAALRRDLHEAATVLGSVGGSGTRPGGSSTRRRQRRHAAAAQGRVTPPEVTRAVVRAAIAKLGESTASEIASEISLAGAPVGGRAARFLAEGVGATVRIGADGRRRYRLG
jgi:hypothetical protein